MFIIGEAITVMVRENNECFVTKSGITLAQVNFKIPT